MMSDRIICIIAYLGMACVLLFILKVSYNNLTDKVRGLILLGATICFCIGMLCLILPY